MLALRTRQLKYYTHGYINIEKKYIINCLECKEIELYKS